MTDCFGIEVSEEEISRWNVLIGNDEWTQRWFVSMGSPYENVPVAPDEVFHLRIPVGDALNTKIIMEVGCGFGVHARNCLSYSDYYVGIDVAPICIAASSYLHRNISKAKFWHTVYDSEMISSLEGRVGGMFGVDFFYHQPFERLSPIVRFCHRMLHDGGWLSIDQIHGFERKGPPVGGMMGAAWDSFQEKRESLVQFLSSVGFSDVRVEESDFPWGQKLDFVICRK